MFRFMQPLKIPLQESLGRQWQLFTDIPTAWVALPSLPVGGDRGAAMAPRAENLWPILQSVKFIFFISSKSTTMYSKL